MLEKWNKYFTTYNIRFNKKQKSVFINELKEEFKEYKLEYSLLEGKSFLSKFNNHIFGNLKTAKTIITIPYDTSNIVLWPNYKYYPFDGDKTQMKSMLPTFIPALLIYGVMLLVITFLPKLFIDFQTNSFLQFITVLFSFLSLLIIMKYTLTGFANRKNYNRNTSGIIASLKLLETLNKDTLATIAFVYTDKNYNKFNGSKLLNDHLESLNRNPLIINLNCVGTGSLIGIGAGKNGNKKLREIIKTKHVGNYQIKKIDISEQMSYATPLMYLKNTIMISCGDNDDKNNFYISNVNNKSDNKINEELIDEVVSIMKVYLEHK